MPRGKVIAGGPNPCPVPLKYHRDPIANRQGQLQNPKHGVRHSARTESTKTCFAETLRSRIDCLNRMDRRWIVATTRDH